MSRSEGRVWFVVIDDEFGTFETLQDRLGDDVAVFGFTEAEKAIRFLGGEYHLSRQYDSSSSPSPVGFCVLVDLLLAEGEPNGMDALCRLPLDKPTVALLHTGNPEDPMRQLLALACAEIWDTRTGSGGIGYLTRSATPGKLRQLVAGVRAWETTLRSGVSWSRGETQMAHRPPRFEHLEWLSPLCFAKPSRVRPVTFLEWLTEKSWVVPFLDRLARGEVASDALNQVHITGGVTTAWDALGPLVRSHACVAPKRGWLSYGSEPLRQASDFQLQTLDIKTQNLVTRFAIENRYLFNSPLLLESLELWQRARARIG